MSIRHIAFDLDGTLIDTRDQIVESVLACLPATDRTAWTRARVRSKINLSPRAILAQFGIRTPTRYWRNHAALAVHSKVFFDDTVYVFRELKRRGISTSVVTSLPARPANALIEAIGIAEFLSLIDTFASRPYRKPSPKLITMHLRDCGIECDEAAYVGDTVGDMQMAALAGAHAWAVGWSTASKIDLVNAGAERTLESIREIVGIVP